MSTSSSVVVSEAEAEKRASLATDVDATGTLSSSVTTSCSPLRDEPGSDVDSTVIEKENIEVKKESATIGTGTRAMKEAKKVWTQRRHKKQAEKIRRLHGDDILESSGTRKRTSSRKKKKKKHKRRRVVVYSKRRTKESKDLQRFLRDYRVTRLTSAVSDSDATHRSAIAAKKPKKTKSPKKVWRKSPTRRRRRKPLQFSATPDIHSILAIPKSLKSMAQMGVGESEIDRSDHTAVDSLEKHSASVSVATKSKTKSTTTHFTTTLEPPWTRTLARPTSMPLTSTKVPNSLSGAPLKLSETKEGESAKSTKALLFKDIIGISAKDRSGVQRSGYGAMDGEMVWYPLDFRGGNEGSDALDYDRYDDEEMLRQSLSESSLTDVSSPASSYFEEDVDEATIRPVVSVADFKLFPAVSRTPPIKSPTKIKRKLLATPKTEKATSKKTKTKTKSKGKIANMKTVVSSREQSPTQRRVSKRLRKRAKKRSRQLRAKQRRKSDEVFVKQMESGMAEASAQQMGTASAKRRRRRRKSGTKTKRAERRKQRRAIKDAKMRGAEVAVIGGIEKEEEKEYCENAEEASVSSSVNETESAFEEESGSRKMESGTSESGGRRRKKWKGKRRGNDELRSFVSFSTEDSPSDDSVSVSASRKSALSTLMLPRNASARKSKEVKAVGARRGRKRMRSKKMGTDSSSLIMAADRLYKLSTTTSSETPRIKMIKDESHTFGDKWFKGKIVWLNWQNKERNRRWGIIKLREPVTVPKYQQKIVHLRQRLLREVRFYGKYVSRGTEETAVKHGGVGLWVEFRIGINNAFSASARPSTAAAAGISLMDGSPHGFDFGGRHSSAKSLKGKRKRWRHSAEDTIDALRDMQGFDDRALEALTTVARSSGQPLGDGKLLAKQRILDEAASRSRLVLALSPGLRASQYAAEGFTDFYVAYDVRVFDIKMPTRFHGVVVVPPHSCVGGDWGWLHCDETNLMYRIPLPVDARLHLQPNSIVSFKPHLVSCAVSHKRSGHKTTVKSSDSELSETSSLETEDSAPSTGLSPPKLAAAARVSHELQSPTKRNTKRKTLAQVLGNGDALAIGVGVADDSGSPQQSPWSESSAEVSAGDQPEDGRHPVPQLHHTLYGDICFGEYNATSIKLCERISGELIEDKYLNGNQGCDLQFDKYVYGRELSARESLTVELKCYDLFSNVFGTTDTDIIVESTEKYVNGFANGKYGGVILFGVRDDGTVIGQQCMSREKEDDIRLAIDARLKRWQPRAYAYQLLRDCVEVHFIDVIRYDDTTIATAASSSLKHATRYGYVLPEVKVIKVTVSGPLRDEASGQLVTFCTSKGQVWNKFQASIVNVTKATATGSPTASPMTRLAHVSSDEDCDDFRRSQSVPLSQTRCRSKSRSRAPATEKVPKRRSRMAALRSATPVIYSLRRGASLGSATFSEILLPATMRGADGVVRKSVAQMVTTALSSAWQCPTQARERVSVHTSQQTADSAPAAGHCAERLDDSSIV